MVCASPMLLVHWYSRRVAISGVIAYVLPGDFKIKAAKLRGEPSEGMLCSFSELGISDDHNGIIELPADVGANRRIRRQFDNAAVIVRNAQFREGAQHPFRRFATQFRTACRSLVSN